MPCSDQSPTRSDEMQADAGAQGQFTDWTAARSETRWLAREPGQTSKEAMQSGLQQMNGLQNSSLSSANMQRKVSEEGSQDETCDSVVQWHPFPLFLVAAPVKIVFPPKKCSLFSRVTEQLR